MFMIVKSQHSSDLFKHFVHFSALCWNWVFPISLYPALSSSVMDFHFSASMSLISFTELFGLPRSSFGYSSFGETTYPYAGRLRSCLGTPFSWFSWSCAAFHFCLNTFFNSLWALRALLLRSSLSLTALACAS